MIPRLHLSPAFPRAKNTDLFPLRRRRVRCSLSRHAQEPINAFAEIDRADLTLPDREDTPSHPLQGVPGARVAFDVLGELRTPIRPIGCWLPPTSRTRVLVPEAPVDEDHGAALRQHQVWRARQIAAMEAESVPQPVDEASDGNFGARVRRLHARHDGAALIGREAVVHLAAVLPARFARAF